MLEDAFADRNQSRRMVVATTRKGKGREAGGGRKGSALTPGRRASGAKSERPAVSGQSKAARAPGPFRSDAALEAAVDSLRRMLSELIEQRMESVVRNLVEVRREAASRTDGARERTLERLDQLLQGLGAVRFAAEPMDLVDPLIHSVVEERRVEGAPDGVILEAIGPGTAAPEGSCSARRRWR